MTKSTDARGLKARRGCTVDGEESMCMKSEAAGCVMEENFSSFMAFILSKDCVPREMGINGQRSIVRLLSYYI